MTLASEKEGCLGDAEVKLLQERGQTSKFKGWEPGIEGIQHVSQVIQCPGQACKHNNNIICSLAWKNTPHCMLCDTVNLLVCACDAQSHFVCTWSDLHINTPAMVANQLLFFCSCHKALFGFVPALLLQVPMASIKMVLTDLINLTSFRYLCKILYTKVCFYYCQHA